MRNAIVLVFIALGASIIWQELRFWPFYIDDSYISLVYAKNWISGNGLTYNGKVVEGYSNFLWVILLGIVGRTGVDLELASRLLGMLFSLLALPLLAALGWQLCRHHLAGWLAGALLGVSGPFLAWAIGGLETMLFVALLLLTLHLVLKEQSEHGAPYSAIAAILLALTRPEGVGIALVVVGYLALMARYRRTSHSYVARWVAVFAIGFGAFLAWRYLYYHDWLPASVLAKRGSFAAQVAAARFRLQPLLWSWSLAAASSALGFAILFILPTASRSAVLLLASVTLAYAVFLVLSGADWMPMHRFVVPLLPLLFLGLASGFVALAEWAARGRARWLGLLLPLLVTAAAAAQIAVWTEQNRESSVSYGVASSRGVKELALWLLAHAPPGASIAAIDAGALAYYSGLPTLDLIGLNDQHIAHLPGGFGTRLDKAYVLAAKPTYVELHPLRSSSGQPIFIDFLPSARLYYDLEFQRWYDIDYTVPMHAFVRRQAAREHTFMDNFYEATYREVTVKNAAAGQRAQVEIVVQNDGSGVWVGAGQLVAGAVYVVCRLRDPATGALTAEQWGPLGQDLAPGDRRLVRIPLPMPEQTGDYVLEIDLVLNEVAWFSAQGQPVKTIAIHL